MFMLLYEVIIDKVERNSVAMVFNLLAERISKARKPAHVHSHSKILPFYIGYPSQF